ncbi:hypothetical protein BDZ89DRAFT_101604 [Hymenopellis radicata]|nr:hypothetical protein BDZ89DRAFT_101604 [Hymenopellis radicata]
MRRCCRLDEPKQAPGPENLGWRVQRLIRRRTGEFLPCMEESRTWWLGRKSSVCSDRLFASASSPLQSRFRSSKDMTLQPSSSIVFDSEPPSPIPPPKPRKTYGKRKQDVPTADAASEGAMDASRLYSLAPSTVTRRPDDVTNSSGNVVHDTTQDTYDGDSEPKRSDIWDKL